MFSTDQEMLEAAKLIADFMDATPESVRNLLRPADWIEEFKNVEHLYTDEVWPRTSREEFVKLWRAILNLFPGLHVDCYNAEGDWAHGDWWVWSSVAPLPDWYRLAFGPISEQTGWPYGLTVFLKEAWRRYALVGEMHYSEMYLAEEGEA